MVSDDQGPPGIRALVERLAQPDCIRYLRTPQRLGLRGNFEHCVTHSRGRYVTILGDDDGLCRNALDVARTLLASTQPNVFFWFPHIYWWPDALLPHKRWMVYVRAYAKKARLVNAREYVDRFYDEHRKAAVGKGKEFAESLAPMFNRAKSAFVKAYEEFTKEA